MIYRVHTDLPVCQAAFTPDGEVFRMTQTFPIDETYSLTDQVRRSSRSVCAKVAEAWRKRRYEKHFVSTLNIAEGETAETQVWLQFAVECDYFTPDSVRQLYQSYDEILAHLVALIRNPKPWILTNP